MVRGSLRTLSALVIRCTTAVIFSNLDFVDTLIHNSCSTPIPSFGYQIPFKEFHRFGTFHTLRPYCKECRIQSEL